MEKNRWRKKLAYRFRRVVKIEDLWVLLRTGSLEISKVFIYHVVFVLSVFLVVSLPQVLAEKNKKQTNQKFSNQIRAWLFFPVSLIIWNVTARISMLMIFLSLQIFSSEMNSKQRILGSSYENFC